MKLAIHCFISVNPSSVVPGTVGRPRSPPRRLAPVTSRGRRPCASAWASPPRPAPRRRRRPRGVHRHGRGVVAGRRVLGRVRRLPSPWPVGEVGRAVRAQRRDRLPTAAGSPSWASARAGARWWTGSCPDHDYSRALLAARSGPERAGVRRKRLPVAPYTWELVTVEETDGVRARTPSPWLAVHPRRREWLNEPPAVLVVRGIKCVGHLALLLCSQKKCAFVRRRRVPCEFNSGRFRALPFTAGSSSSRTCPPRYSAARR